MAEPFDPYYMWLGVPPEDQPPDHYRLLGVKLFEESPDVISNAANRQMAHIRTFQLGEHQLESQGLLNELSTARICLLNRDKKAVYDDGLRASLEAVVQPASLPVGMPFVSESVRSKRTATRLSKRNPIEIAKIVAGGVAGVILTFFLLYGFVLLGRSDRRSDRANGTEAGTPVPAVADTVTQEPELPEESAMDSAESPDEASAAIEAASLDEPLAAASVSESASSADETAGGRGAVISVVRKVSTPLGDDPNLPLELRGGTTFNWRTKPGGANIKNGVLEFTVEETGVVYLNCSWKYEGNSSGGWYQERLTREQLAKQGWEDLGPCPWNKDRILFRKLCKEGEQYAIRVNKYGPPGVLLPPRMGK